jgi:peroxiredoxin
MMLQYEAQNNTFISQRFRVSEKYFDDFIINFVNKCRKKQICAGLLYHQADMYARQGNEEKSLYFVKRLKRDYADQFYVDQGHANAIVNRLKIVTGNPAPLFSVKSLTGDSLKLVDYAGKFVFIDFWGSWCGPCLGELPHLRQLSKAISNDKLQIIGLARDDSTKLVKFLEKEPLPYPNALADNDLLSKFGIAAFPTTILIGPNGKIVGKNLRGKNLVDLVKEKMDEWSK